MLLSVVARLCTCIATAVPVLAPRRRQVESGGVMRLGRAEHVGTMRLRGGPLIPLAAVLL